VTLIGAILLACMGLPFLFIPVGPGGLIFVIIVFTIAGFVDAAIITMTMPLFSSVIDNATIETGKRREGLYKGVWLFFSRIGLAIRAIVFWIVQIIFGYHSGSTDPFELLGLRFQLSIFPMIISGFGILVFWRLYQITPEQLEINLEKLKELKL
jgi:Na+/melibiose symporter-like transporter